MNNYFIPDEEQPEFQSGVIEPQKQQFIGGGSGIIGSYGKESPTAEGLELYALRNILRSGVRAGEQILGGYGNIGQIGSLLRGLAPGAPPEPEGYFERLKRFGKSSLFGPFGMTPLEALPTSEELRSGVRKITDYFEPRTAAEETIDELVQSTVALASPTKLGGAGAGIKKSFILSSLGLGTEELLKAYGVSPEKAQMWGEGVKFGGILSSDAPKMVRGIMDKVRSTIPKSTINPKEYQNSLRTLISKLEKGGVMESEKKAYDIAKEQLNRLTRDKGKIFIAEGEELLKPLDLEELVKVRDKINEARYKETALGQRVLDERSRVHLNKLDEIINKSIDTFSKDAQAGNWVKDYREAQKLASDIHESDRLARNISKKIKIEDLEKFEPETVQIFAAEASKGLKGRAKSLFETVKIPYAKWRQFYKRFSSSPILRKYYGQVVKNGLEGYTAEAVRALNKFDAQLKKEKKKQEFIEQQEAKTVKPAQQKSDYFIPD